MDKRIIDELNKPFMEEEIEWSPAEVTLVGSNPVVYLFPHIDARAIMARLDNIFGIDGWSREISSNDSGVMCALSIFLNGKWVTKSDGAGIAHSKEGFKAASTMAFKRAAVNFGIGRYLYTTNTKVEAEVKIKAPLTEDGWNEYVYKYTKYFDGLGDGEEKLRFYWRHPRFTYESPAIKLHGEKDEREVVREFCKRRVGLYEEVKFAGMSFAVIKQAYIDCNGDHDIFAQILGV